MDDINTTDNTLTPSKKALNWILILANLIIIASTFLNQYLVRVLLPFSNTASRPPFRDYDIEYLDTLFDITIGNDQSILNFGYIFIALAALNILFALCRKRIPTYIITVVMTLLIFTVIYIITNTIHFRLETGFYILLAGTFILVTSHFIFNRFSKKI
jgi:hypothetical protein